MSSYIQNLKAELKEYYNILSKGGIPEFLVPYIETKEMQKIGGIQI